MPYLFVLLLTLLSTVFAVEQEQATPYDLIRPVFPRVWDTIPSDAGGTVESFSSFVPNKSKRNPVPKVGSMPKDYVANGFVPDTLNQAFLDARNLRIGRIRVNQAGYLTEDAYKHFYYVSKDSKCGDTYSVVDLNDNEVAKDGKFTSTGHTTESSWKIVAATDAATNNQNRYTASAVGPSGTVCEGFLSEMSLPTDQRLRIKVGKEYSSTFIISDRVYSMVRDATIKFYGINRSGNSESWFHKPSHTKDGGGSFVNGQGEGSGVTGFTAKEGALQGGWYDCGDHLKESQTQAYAFMVLAVMAASNPDRDDDNYAYNHGETVNTDGVPDILREAKHGADFFLRAFAFADGVVDNMAVSVGNFGADHGWWGRPENQDALPTTVTGRGGPHERDIRLGELGSNISGQIAAGLAILSKDYATYDKDFADSCLMVAEKMYDFAKNLKLKEKSLGPGTYDGGKKYVFNTKADGWSSAAYNGNNESHDDLAIAAVALHYATYEKTGKMDYLNDAVEDKEIGVTQEATFGFFPGGWMAWSRDGMRKSSKNTSWANAYTYTLYGFYKLLLKDEETAAKFGITKEKRLEYAEDVAYTLATNLGNMASTGSNSITLPGLYNDPVMTYGDLWYNMQTDQTWIYNRYQAGNIFEVFAYADVTKDLEGVKLPGKGVRQWHSKEMKQLGINQLNYMLGMNPWDVSYLLGVGDKNDAHPHHRAANPEGKNVPGAAYKYSPPVGALYGGITPSASGANDMAPDGRSWEDYHKAETCVDGTAMFLAAGALAVKEEDRNRAPSQINVEIRYAGFDSAIVNINQDVRGTVMILASTNETGPFTDMYVDSVPGVKHTITMKPLQNGTTYYFKVVAINSRSEKYTTKWLVDSTSTPFNFTTLASAAPDADIQNVKICNLSADSAEVMWYTPNGQYESKVYWDTVLTTYDKMANNTGDTNADVSGIPTSFHYVKFGGLKEKTTYYYCVESNGSRRCVDDKGQPLKFKTPVTQYDFEIRAYQYEFGGMDFLDLNLINKEERAFDSLTLRLYVTAKESEILPVPGVNNQPGSCPLLVDEDICQAYDEAGFNKPCENDREIRDLLRGATPVKLEDTYNASTGTYGWYLPVPLGSTTIKSSSRMRIDFGFSYGIYQNGNCETLRSPASKRMTSTTGDWSWAAHTAGNSSAERVDYEGMPVLDKDFGDGDLAPIDPYIAVYRKDEFVWGYSPSYSEMTTKRAKYEMTVTLDKPFNVSNGSYIRIDSTKSTMMVTGTALITEGGFVTSIWVNGTALSKEQVASAAIYNYDTQKYDLNIPVKLGIGTNKVDVTIFAGPDPECEACQENGGCAFVNRSYFVQFSKGDRTAGILTLTKEDGSAVSSPAPTDGSLKFYINVKDKDNRDSKTISALLVNSRTKDTLKVTLNRVNEVTGEFRSDLINGVGEKDPSFPKISFMGGDTVKVIYIDAEDEEDIATQSFYADPTHPIPSEVLVLGDDCEGVPEKISAAFSSVFSKKITLDSAVVSFDETEGMSTKSYSLQPVGGQVVDGSDVEFDITSIKLASAAPTGSIEFFMTENGILTSETAVLKDGIAPALKQILLLENSEPRSEQDTVKLVFTEPVSIPSMTEWPLGNVGDGSKEIKQDGIVVKNVYTTDNGTSWIYVIEGNTDGEIVKGKNDDHAGYKAEIKYGFKVADYGFNEVATCKPVEIIEAVRAIHIANSVISDKEGDGQPDQIVLNFVSLMDEKHTPDSLLVYWGNPAQYHAFQMPKNGWNFEVKNGDTTKTPVIQKSDSSFKITDRSYWDFKTENVVVQVQKDSLDEDGNTVEYWVAENQVKRYDSVKVEVIDTVWTYDLDTLDEWIETIATYSSLTLDIDKGVFKGLTVGPRQDHRGVVIQGGSFFDADTSFPADDCPPILVDAVWRSEMIGSIDLNYLDITASEPLGTDSTKDYYVERLRNGEKGKYLLRSGNSLIADPFISSDQKTVSFRYYYDADSVIWSGDSVRFVPEAAKSYFRDQEGNFPGVETPWIPVTGQIEKVRFITTLLNSVTKKSADSSYYGDFQPSEDEHFRLSMKNASGEYVIASGKQSLDPVGREISNYAYAGPVFKIDVQLPKVFEKDSVEYNYKFGYQITIKLKLYNNLGSFVNEMDYTVDLSKLMEYVSANSVATFYVEWCSPLASPPSLGGKIVGSGAYVAKFDFGAKAEYIVDPASPAYESGYKPIKGSGSKTLSFGVRH